MPQADDDPTLATGEQLDRIGETLGVRRSHRPLTEYLQYDEDLASRRYDPRDHYEDDQAYRQRILDAMRPPRTYGSVESVSLGGRSFPTLWDRPLGETYEAPVMMSDIRTRDSWIEGYVQEALARSGYDGITSDVRVERSPTDPRRLDISVTMSAPPGDYRYATDAFTTVVAVASEEPEVERPTLWQHLLEAN